MNYGKSKNKTSKKVILQKTTKEDGTKYSSAKAFKKDIGVSPKKVAKSLNRMNKTMSSTGTVQKGAVKK